MSPYISTSFVPDSGAARPPASRNDGGFPASTDFSNNPLLRRREDERAELFFEAKPFSVVLQDGACGGILIHRDALAAKGA